MRKPGVSPQYSLKTGGRKACTIATIRHARALFPASDENGHAVELARNLWSGSYDSDGAGRLPCRPAFLSRSQSRAAVRLHRRSCRFRQRHRLRHGLRRHCGGVISAVLPQPSRHARLRHVGPGAHAAAGGYRRRHRADHRPVAAEMGRCVRVGEEASCHRGPAVGRARSGRYRHRAARFRYPRRIHQPRLPRLFRSCPTSRPTATRPSSH